MNNLRKMLLAGGLALTLLFGAAATSQAQSFSFSVHSGDPHYRGYHAPRYYYPPPRRVYYAPARHYYRPAPRYYRHHRHSRHEYRENRSERREHREHRGRR